MTGLTVDQIVRTTLVLLAIGVVLISSLLLIPGKREAAKDTFEAMLSMLVVTVTTLVMFWGGPLTLIPFLLLLAYRTGYEAALVLFGQIHAIKIGIGAAVISAIAVSIPVSALAFAGFWMLLLARRVMVPMAADSSLRRLVDLLIYPILPVGILSAAALTPELRPIVLLIYVLVELFDSHAYACGKFLGRTPAFPKLSPKKTIEGLIGGAVCILLISTGTAWAVGLSVSQAALLTVLACVFGIAGDLAASRIKREGGVKDYPVVLKKQGGALDIWDSWIAAGAAISVLILIRDLM